MASGEEEIYQEHVLDHYEDPFHRGHAENCTHCHEDDNPLCGDTVSIELSIDEEGQIWIDPDNGPKMLGIAISDNEVRISGYLATGRFETDPVSGKVNRLVHDNDGEITVLHRQQ